MTSTNKRDASKAKATPDLRERAAATKASAKRVVRKVLSDQPSGETLPAGVAVEQAAQPFRGTDQSAQSPVEGLGKARNRDGADGGVEPAGETAMGRHESFENAAPIAEGLLSGTMLNWLPTGDPILPVIEEARRLWLAHDALLEAREDGQVSEQESDAHSAMWAHVRGPLLETVPLTAEGCRALARFAVEYSADQGVSLAESDSGQDPILALIARSPLADPPQRFDAVRRFGARPVSALLEAHRTAWVALNEASNPADEEFVRQAGGDTSDEAMASARKAVELASAAESAAWEALLAGRPDDAGSLAEMFRYIALSPATEIVGDPKYLLGHIAEAAAAVCRRESDAASSAEGDVSSELRNLIDQHHALLAQFSDEALTEAQADPLFDQAYGAFRSACAFRPVGPADVFAKFALMLPELQETAGRMSSTAQFAVERLAVDLSMPAAAAWLGRSIARGPTQPMESVSTELAVLLREWDRLGGEIKMDGISDSVLDVISPRHTEIQIQIGLFACRSLADLRAKIPVFKDELADAVSGLADGDAVESTLSGSAWIGLIRDIEWLSDRHEEGQDPSPPATVENIAHVPFEAYSFDEPVKSPREWVNTFLAHGMGMHIADRTLRMTKAKLIDLIRGAEKRGDGAEEAMFDVLDSSQETLEGWGKMLSLARSRYLVAASAVAVEETEA